jgi:hypothetical protein
MSKGRGHRNDIRRPAWLVAWALVTLAVLQACATPAAPLPPTAEPVRTAFTATHTATRTAVTQPSATPTSTPARPTSSPPTHTPVPTLSPTISVSVPTQLPVPSPVIQEPEVRFECTLRDDDYQLQREQAIAILAHENLSPRTIQVDLNTHIKVSQYRPEVINAYGFNACGLVAAAAAMGGNDWLPLAAQVRAASGDAYAAASGIQPSPYANALARVFGAESVREENEWPLCSLHQALRDGAVVIVDIQVGSGQNALPETPTTDPPDYAHFARVLGIDLETEKVYVENTLQGKNAYWELSLEEFWRTWRYPETDVSIRAPNPEEVTRWAVIIQPNNQAMSVPERPRG